MQKRTLSEFLGDILPEIIIFFSVFTVLIILIVYRLEIFNFLWLDFISDIACEIFETKVLKLECGGWE